MNHVMIDTETLGMGSRAVVKSIGAVVFDPDDIQMSMIKLNDPSYHFYKTISLSDADLEIGEISISTIEWWMCQDGETRKELFTPNILAVSMKSALTALQQFFQEHKVVYVWANAPSFDLVILKHHYDAHGLDLPWPFRNELCVRTILHLANMPLKNIEGYISRIKHHALEDAKFQAKGVLQAYRHLQIGL